MLDSAYVRKMARYNRWQNANLCGCAARLTEEERARERSAFFGSVQKPLLHLIRADALWLPYGWRPSRRCRHRRPAQGKPSRPLSPGRTLSFRATLWILRLRLGPTGAIPNGSRATSFGIGGLMKPELTRPKWALVTHMFTHQTHHRGQMHCMLTQAGVKPDDTDLWILPE